MARPKKVIDYSMVEKLASIMATQEEIAVFLDISVRTLQRDKEFCRIYKKGLESGKMSLRRKQFKLAEKNATMGIWLGKQYLNQKDKQQIEHSGDLGVTIEDDL
jgi:hypothetical protein